MDLKYKPRKCKICGKTDFKNPRALSMHMHIAHKNLDEIEVQHMIANTFLGSAKLAVYMKQLDAMSAKEQDEDETIPPVVKKYWKLLRAETNKKEKLKKDREERQAELEKKNKPSKPETAQKLHVLAANAVKSRLQNQPPESILGIFIKDLDTYHFITDAEYDSKEKIINLQTARSADPETKKVPSKSGKLLTVEELLYLLENGNVAGTAQFIINSASGGGSKLTKVSNYTYEDKISAVLFTFEYDKAYYKQYMAKYFAKRKKQKDK